MFGFMLNELTKPELIPSKILKTTLVQKFNKTFLQ